MLINSFIGLRVWTELYFLHLHLILLPHLNDNALKKHESEAFMNVTN